MAQRNIKFAQGEFYHIYSRGNGKKDIFFDDQDRDRFVKLLYLSNCFKKVNFRDDIITQKIDVWDFDRGTPLVSIGAWVLMSNHVHMLLTIPVSNSPQPGSGDENQISVFVGKLLGSYTKYINKKYGRTGGLFESKFKATHVNTDEYLKYIFSYIHLNPIKIIDPEWKERGIQDIQKAKDFLKTYYWSSYLDSLNTEREQRAVLTPADFPEYFANPDIFQEEIFDWLKFNPENIIK